MLPLRLFVRAPLVLAMFVLGAFLVLFVLLPMRHFASRSAPLVADRIAHLWNRVLCRIVNLRIDISGTPDSAIGLTVSNHISWLDIIAIGSIKSGVFVAKEEVADWPILGFLAQGIGTIFIKRGDPTQTAVARESMTWYLKRGRRLFLFPEGTTTQGIEVLRFHSKLFQPAERSGVRVQAVGLKYQGESEVLAPFVGDDEFVPHLLSILKLPEIRLSLYFAKPIEAGSSREFYAKTSRVQIREWLKTFDNQASFDSLVAVKEKKTGALYVSNPTPHSR